MDTPTDAAARRRSLLRTIERALYEALSESSEVHRAIWELQRDGVDLQLTLSCSPSTRRKGSNPARSAATATPPAFRIDGDDLRFLRSVGIDPTRSRRSRRRG